VLEVLLAFSPLVAPISWFMTKAAIPQEAKIIAKPIAPALKILFASAIFSSFPSEVIHLKPPSKTIPIAIILKIPKKTLIIVAIMVRGSRLLKAIVFPTTLAPVST